MSQHTSQQQGGNGSILTSSAPLCSVPTNTGQEPLPDEGMVLPSVGWAFPHLSTCNLSTPSGMPACQLHPDNLSLRLSWVTLDCVWMRVNTNHRRQKTVPCLLSHRLRPGGSSHPHFPALNLITKSFCGRAAHLPTPPLWHSLHQLLQLPHSQPRAPSSPLPLLPFRAAQSTDSSSHLLELCLRLQLPLRRNDKD